MTTQSTLCPKCDKPSTDLWMRLYAGEYTGRVWGGRCAKDGLWANSTACTPRPKETSA